MASGQKKGGGKTSSKVKSLVAEHVLALPKSKLKASSKVRHSLQLLHDRVVNLVKRLVGEHAVAPPNA